MADCEQPPWFWDSALDCDDDNATVPPGGEEICDGVDNDCDGIVDSGCESEAEESEEPTCSCSSGSCSDLRWALLVVIGRVSTGCLALS